MPSTGRDAPTASCSVLPFCRYRAAFWEQGGVLATKVAGPCLGAAYTKESLSLGRQPSLFKGRNQSWFHPLRTPSRPGAPAPGPQRGAGNNRWPFRIPSTGRDAPTASCSVLRYSFVIVSRFESRARTFPPRRQRFQHGDPSARKLARDDRSGKAPRPQGFTRSLPSCQRCRTLESRRPTLTAVSYTHLDVYKRQAGPCHLRGKNSALFPKRRTIPTEW